MFVYTIFDIAFVACFLGTLLVIVFFGVIDYIRQKMCKHEEFHENIIRHAICYHCDKDLGYIKDWESISRISRKDINK